MPHSLEPILVVDDSEDEIELMLRAFEEAGLLNPICVVTDGDQAIAYLQGTGKFTNREEYPLPSLILLDLKMPSRNGFEVLEWIRKHPDFKKIRVVVLTNSGAIGDVNRAYSLGANSFVVKPAHKKQFADLAESISGYWIWTSKAPEVERPKGFSKPD
jgi:CheY-like chemotaxis protein